MEFNKLKKNLKKDFTGFSKVKLALLGDSATQFIAQAIRGAGFEQQLDIRIYEADFNQVDRQILDLSSELYAFKPNIILIFESGHNLLKKFDSTEENKRIDFAEKQLSRISQLMDVLQNNINTKVIYANYTEEDDRVFGSYANKIPSSFIFQQRKLNYRLSEYASKNAGFYICDLSYIQNKLGHDRVFTPSIYINSEMTVSIDAIPFVAEAVIQIISAIQGKIKKCVILDLDGTIWGGVIGDDGLENIQIGSLGIGKAFSEFQYWIKKLRQRGIIICICSKNTESIAKEPFEKHPDMVLKLNDISLFIANWESKVDNINHIQQVLNIAFDSMVFLDDNPFERNVVRQNIPGICVPELPDDPADYLGYLYGLNLFETASYSSQDSKRTEQYQNEIERKVAQASFTSEEDFLKSLDMTSDVESFNSFTIPRVAQLSQRTNQFNLRTIRYTEDDISRIAASDAYATFTFTLNDKYGDNGLVCAIILEIRPSKELFIDTWFMSCRVFKRGLENFAMNTIADFAREEGYQTITGEYIPTVKNILVKEHYKNLGFIQDDALWRLDIDTYKTKECFIKKRRK